MLMIGQSVHVKNSGEVWEVVSVDAFSATLESVPYGKRRVTEALANLVVVDTNSKLTGRPNLGVFLANN